MSALKDKVVTVHMVVRIPLVAFNAHVGQVGNWLSINSSVLVSSVKLMLSIGL